MQFPFLIKILRARPKYASVKEEKEVPFWITGRVFKCSLLGIEGLGSTVLGDSGT